jgi:hypothetical protein
VIIKAPKKRIEFERLLKKLGYVDRRPIYPKEQKRTKQTNYLFEDGSMAIYTHIFPYFNKKSYIYKEFLDHYGDSNLKEKIKCLAKVIRFEEKTRIADVAWDAVYTKQPTDFTLEERKKVFFDFMKQTKFYILNGLMDLNPQEGDILAANPRGPKINQGFTEESMVIGAKQRSIVDRKFGFGNIYDDGFQYCRYDKDLIPQPI